MKVIDGMVWCNEIEKWVTPGEYLKECFNDVPGFEGTIDALNDLTIWSEPSFDWDNEVSNGR